MQNFFNKIITEELKAKVFCGALALIAAFALLGAFDLFWSAVMARLNGALKEGNYLSLAISLGIIGWVAKDFYVSFMNDYYKNKDEAETDEDEAEEDEAAKPNEKN